MGDFYQQLVLAPLHFKVIAVIVTLAALFFSFHYLKLVRLIEDVPTAKIRSAPQGYVELIGTAQLMQGTPIVSPLSGRKCCWYKYSIEQRRDDRWRNVDSGTSDGIFLAKDETGECVIDPDGAKVTTSHNSSWIGSWNDRNKMASKGYDFGLLNINVNNVSNVGFGNYRYKEELILPGDPLYAIGWFKSLSKLDHQETISQMTANILREWKRNKPALLAAFDKNHDGEIDMKEWEQARKLAGKHARDEYRESLSERPLHTLSKPKTKQKFVLSNLSQEDLVKRYRWYSYGGFAVLFIGVPVSAVMWVG